MNNLSDHFIPMFCFWTVFFSTHSIYLPPKYCTYQHFCNRVKYEFSSFLSKCHPCYLRVPLIFHIYPFLSFRIVFSLITVLLCDIRNFNCFGYQNRSSKFGDFVLSILLSSLPAFIVQLSTENMFFLTATFRCEIVFCFYSTFCGLEEH